MLYICVCILRKLAKSTLVLVLVFGIHYIIFVGMPHTFQGPSWEIRMYCELFFNSFQVLFFVLLEPLSNIQNTLLIHFALRKSTHTCVRVHFSVAWDNMEGVELKMSTVGSLLDLRRSIIVSRC